MTTLPASSSRCVSFGVMFLILAFVWTPSVTMPACAPVSETAGTPIACSAIAVSAMVVCSPVASSMSISRSRRRVHDLLGEPDQAVGDAAHRRDHDDDLVALRATLAHAPGDILDAVGVTDRGAAVFLDDQRHS